MSTAIAKKSPESQFKDFLYQNRQRIQDVLPKHMDADRLLRITLMLTTRQPAIRNCSQQSVILAVMQAAALGLEVGGALGQAYLVPYGTECQFIPGYRGLIDLARRSGSIVGVEARVVRKGDTFKVDLGMAPTIVHSPAMEGPPGDVIAVYAIATMPGGYKQADVMTLAEVEAVRNRSRASKSGPWVTDFAEMAKKTVVRRLCKYLPLSVELAAAIEADTRAETGVAGGYSPLLDEPAAVLDAGHPEVPKPAAVEQIASAKARQAMKPLTEEDQAEAALREPGSDDA